MKRKLLVLISFILLSGMVFGQENVVDSLEIRRIDSLVNIIMSDSTISKTAISGIKLSIEDLDNIDVYLKGNEVVRISLFSSFPVAPTNYRRGSSTINYFINNGNLFFIREQYLDNSRTGSCGTLNIVNKLYYKGDILLETIKEETPFRCYGTPIATNWLYNTFKEIYVIAKKHADNLNTKQ